MKKYKPIVSLVLAVLLLLAACGRQLADPTDPSETEATAATARPPLGGSDWDRATRPETTFPDQYTTEINVKVQYLPAAVENPENLPVLKWLCLLQKGDAISYERVWSEAAAVEVNQLLADRNMPFRVQFAIYMSDYSDLVTLDWFARPEIQEDLKTADLILHNMPMDQVEAYLEPITQYVTGNAEPTLKNAVPHERNWSLTTKDGEIYGISYCNDHPVCAGWRVDPKLLTDFGLTEQDFQKEFWEMDEVLAKIYEKNGNTPFFYVEEDGLMGKLASSLGRTVWSYYPSPAGHWFMSCFIDVGSVFAVDFSQEKPTVINMLDTELCRKFRAAVKRYSDAGYLIRESGEEYLLAVSQYLASRPYSADGGITLGIPVTEPTIDGSKTYMPRCNGVMASSEYKKEAISLLSLIAEDEEFRSLLLYGKEGRDYTVETDGKYERIKQEDGSVYSMQFLSPWEEFNDDFAVVRSDIVYEGMTELETYREIWDKAGDLYYSVTLDFTGLEKEVEEVRIWARYRLKDYTELTEEDYDKLISEINAKGGTKIMAELQRQLDEWVKANPEKAATNRRFG